MTDANKKICFVDMPFGNKADPKTGIEVDFDQVYEVGIKPAIERTGLRAIRSDEERTGGIIHTAMFARLLLAEFVIADMTTANPNVFYELGVRHTAKPYTTIPIFATIGAPPFDVNMVRAIPYDLSNGKLDEEAAAALILALSKRIEHAMTGPVAKDSPLFDLFPDFPGIEISHELTDVFRDRVQYSAQIKQDLARARARASNAESLEAIKGIAAAQGDPKSLERGVLIDIYLSYRAVEAWDEMIALYELMPADVQHSALARQQLAFALNRRNLPGDREQAETQLKQLIAEQGESAETLGLLGRIYKDQYRDALNDESFTASVYLDMAIDAYIRGFEAEPADYYPGVNAINLLLQKADSAALKEVERLSPLVTFAAVRRGGESASDYWTVATVMELAAASRDYDLAIRCLPRTLVLGNESWMFETTAKNLRLLLKLRAGEDGIEKVEHITAALEARAAEVKGE